MAKVYFGILMEYMKTYLVLIFSCLMYTAGVAQEKPTKIHLDPSTAMGASVSQVFAGIKYVPLETTRTSVFGQVSDLVVTDDFFIILDDQTNAILLFRKDGKFYSKISGGPNPSDKIMLFHVDRFSREIQFVKRGNGQPKKYYFGFDGKKRKEADMVLTVHSYLQFAEFPGSVIIGQRYTSGDDFPDSTAYELTVETDQQRVAGYLPYNTKSTALIHYDVRPYQTSPFFRTSSDTTLYFTRYWDYGVYRITPHTFQKQVEFVFPADYSLPQGFMTDTTLRGKRMDYVQANKQPIYLISDFLSIPGNWLLKFKNNQSPVDASTVLDYTLLLYNQRSGLLVDLFKVLPDQLSWRLPIVDQLGNVSQNATAYTDGRYLYTSVSSLSMFLYADRNKEEHVQYEKELDKYFKTRSRKDNPVLIQLEPRQ